MSAQVSNATLAGSAARLSRVRGLGVARGYVDGVDGVGAPPARDRGAAFEDSGDRFASGVRARHGEFQDQVVSFSGVLVSREVGAAIMQAQALKGLQRIKPAEAEVQVAKYEFVQSLAGPAEPIMFSPGFR